jgi:hypothetical protein
MSLRTATSGEPSGKRQTATFKTKNGRSCPSSLISLNDCLAGPRDLEFSSRERQFSAPCSSRPTNEMFGTKLCSGRLLFMKDDVLKPAVRTTCGMASPRLLARKLGTIRQGQRVLSRRKANWLVARGRHDTAMLQQCGQSMRKRPDQGRIDLRTASAFAFR